VWRVRALSELALIDITSLGPADRLLAARQLARACGALSTHAHLDYYLAIWLLDRAEPERAIEVARGSQEIARRFGMAQLHALALVVEGAAHGRLGRRAEMETLLEQGVSRSDGDPTVAGVAWSTGRGIHWLISEDRGRALEAIDTAMTHLRVAPAMANPEQALWALLHTLQDLDGAAACAPVRASGVTIHRLNWALVTLADAVAHGRAGRRDEAERAFAAGDSALAAIPWWRHLVRRLVAEAAIADGWGEPVEWMRDALPDFEARGQDRLAAAARSLLRKAGAPMPRRRQDDAVPPTLRELGVSRRELEVLTLLAEGLPNKEIAERLYLSPRTVERHIANMTAKIGLRTRSELVAFAARHTTIG
jgi:DNA-binding CsgD family transcriptional regulator